MRYFIDAEFNGFGGELVAFAAVPETSDLPPFYEAIECHAPVPWVSANVIPVLQSIPIARSKAAQLFSVYLSSDNEAVLIADWPEDIAFAASLLTNGTGGRLHQRAVRFELLETSDFAAERSSTVPHNAYYDAIALRDWALSRP